MQHARISPSAATTDTETKEKLLSLGRPQVYQNF